MSNAGRKSQVGEWLTDDGLILLEGWARDGLTDKEIAAKIGISQSTFYDWKNKFSQFSEAIKKGKAPVDYKVENQMLKSALGYTVKVKKAVKLKTKKQLTGKGVIEEEHIEFVEEEVYIPPNQAAQFFWLKNRRPDKWRDKVVEAADTSTLDRLDEILTEMRTNADTESETE